MPHDSKDGVHWHEPAGTKKAGFGEFKKQPTPYDAFMESEGIPVFRDIGISSVANLPLHNWNAARTCSSTVPRPSGGCT